MTVLDLYKTLQQDHGTPVEQTLNREVLMAQVEGWQPGGSLCDPSPVLVNMRVVLLEPVLTWKYGRELLLDRLPTSTLFTIDGSALLIKMDRLR